MSLLSRSLTRALVAVLVVALVVILGASASGQASARPSQESVWHTVLHVFQGTRVHLQTGRTSRTFFEIETWYDEARDELRAVVRRDRRIVDRAVGTARSLGGDAALFPFRPSAFFREQLERGLFREVSRGTLRGQPVIWVETEEDEGLRVRIALQAETYQPLQLQLFVDGALVAEIAVLRMEPVSRAGTPLEQPSTGWSSFEGSEVELTSTERKTSLAKARRAFARTTLWSGRKIAGHTVSYVGIGKTSAHTDDGRRATAGFVTIAYGARAAGRRPLVIEQGPARQLARVWALSGEFAPPTGSVDLATFAVESGGRTSTQWVGRLQKAGFLLQISASSRATLLAAARALRPIPATN